MILALSKPPYEIGARRVGCRDGDGKWTDQPYVLLREVTQAEWIDWCLSVGRRATAWEVVGTARDRFFEVTTD